MHGGLYRSRWHYSLHVVSCHFSVFSSTRELFIILRQRFYVFYLFFVETPRSVPPRWFEIVKLKMQLIFNVIESCHNKSRLWCEPHRMPFRPWHWRLGVFFRCCVPDEDADRFWASEMVKLLLGWDFLTGTLRPLTVTFTGHKFPFMALKSTTSPHLSIGTLVNSLIFSTWVFLPDFACLDCVLLNLLHTCQIYTCSLTLKQRPRLAFILKINKVISTSYLFRTPG